MIKVLNSISMNLALIAGELRLLRLAVEQHNSTKENDGSQARTSG